MIEDDLDPRVKKPALKKLDTYSVAELRDYVALLQAEAARAEAEIARKLSANAAAASFFK